ncbi:MAG: ammonia monooxygenase [Rhodospirillaceae bacterium]|nr:ammonia monooxygenase [Rhodospirillaceae bacterium]MDG1885960.1 AbrB family transcriptional regulator [Alphaproteobacteria bacterium]|tara:strand:- start:31 stop:1092 length:1062 start_codon:yes stop_codon:yes gene_type:complete
MKNNKIITVFIAILIGTVGGFIFAIIKIPLPWMLGAMVFVTIAAVSGVPVLLPFMLRQSMVVFIGVLLGSQFTPELFDQISSWLISVIAMLFYGIIVMFLVLSYLKKFGNYEPITAYFSAAPGGLNDMTIIGGEMGGDDRIIALTQASRVLLVVMTIPFLFRIFGGYEAPSGLLPKGQGFDLPFREWCIIGICVTLGPFIARKLKLPAAFLLGSLILTAIAHIAGWSNSSPPTGLVAAAQVILGTAIGCRFTGTDYGEITRVIKISVGSAFILMSTAVGAGLLLSEITGLPWYLVTLAYAPGGLAEMSLIAFGIGQDVPFVATHHLCRIGMVILLAPIAFKLIKKYFFIKTID